MKPSRRLSTRRPSAAARPPARASRLQALRRWYADKAPFVNFGLKFCALMVFLHLLLLAPPCERMIHGLTVMDAGLSGMILNLLGQHSHWTGNTLWTGNKSVVTVLPSCSCIEILCFFATAVLVFPISLAKKLPGILAGTIIILALNLIRTVSLYFIGVHYPGAFTIAHEEIWALILVIAPVGLYIAWIRWASHPAPPLPDAKA